MDTTSSPPTTQLQVLAEDHKQSAAGWLYDLVSKDLRQRAPSTASIRSAQAAESDFLVSQRESDFREI